MAAQKASKNAMDYPAHERSYDRFIRMVKVNAVLTAIIAAIVIYIIAN